MASIAPGMNDVRSMASWRTVRVSPGPPSSTSWWATKPLSRTEWTAMPPGPRPPRAPATISSAVGSGAQSSDAAAMRSRVARAVPEGASTLRSWCSSITSAVSKNGAAISAKRIIRAAPTAKLGAIRQLLAPKAARRASTSPGVRPEVPTTA